ncbi:hypothetical protein BV25DRAFT_1517855 [Artomyces pyxidatus]|uniref:Uncharacterized protein n=1 Tax=Artomyces pyxidatus TaxID=48021 RepID=A0ACB8TCL4_9AGAM|nr:hypothetical protein BV25DRAFT_1517855 [Artomyces pyxidatus]
MSTNETSTTPAVLPPPARRQSSLDASTLVALEKQLKQRPDKHELQERNILKEDNVAPALVAAKERLQRSQLELDQALLQRPKPEELVKGGILKEDEVPGAA